MDSWDLFIEDSSITKTFWSNPINPDPDGDGLSDKIEKEMQLNPYSKDSDYDDLPDGFEAHHPTLKPYLHGDAATWIASLKTSLNAFRNLLTNTKKALDTETIRAEIENYIQNEVNAIVPHFESWEDIAEETFLTTIGEILPQLENALLVYDAALSFVQLYRSFIILDYAVVWLQEYSYSPWTGTYYPGVCVVGEQAAWDNLNQEHRCPFINDFNEPIEKIDNELLIIYDYQPGIGFQTYTFEDLLNSIVETSTYLKGSSAYNKGPVTLLNDDGTPIYSSAQYPVMLDNTPAGETISALEKDLLDFCYNLDHGTYDPITGLYCDYIGNYNEIGLLGSGNVFDLTTHDCAEVYFFMSYYLIFELRSMKEVHDALLNYSGVNP